MSWAPDFEPFLIVPRSIPAYDERFVGFGWNKVSHIMELDAVGYVMPVCSFISFCSCPHCPVCNLDICTRDVQ